MFGPIFYIGKISDESKSIARWTMDWLEKQNLYAGPAVYACANTELALKTLAKPLSKGQPPSLVIVDHNLDSDSALKFSQTLRSCIPECWVIDLVLKHSNIPSESTSLALLKPLKKESWIQLLSHIFITANTPQWAQTVD